MKRTSQLVVAVGVVVVAGLAYAAPGHDRGMGGFPPLQRMARALELSPEQEQTIRGVMAEAKPRFQALRKNARETRKTLMAANPDDPNYAADVAAASHVSSGNAAELVTLAAGVKVQVYALLTDEQKAKASELMANMGERGGRFKRRGRHGPKSCDGPDEPPSPEA
jgi:Spy/CpxP family protein refolding chaperone